MGSLHAGRYDKGRMVGMTRAEIPHGQTGSSAPTTLKLMKGADLFEQT
jgi:hypothetical protein